MHRKILHKRISAFSSNASILSLMAATAAASYFGMTAPSKANGTLNKNDNNDATFLQGFNTNTRKPSSIHRHSDTATALTMISSPWSRTGTNAAAQCESAAAIPVTTSADCDWYYKRVEIPERFTIGHAIFGTLLGKPGLLERYNVYYRLSKKSPEDDVDINVGKSISPFAFQVINGTRQPRNLEEELSKDKKASGGGGKSVRHYEEDSEIVVADIQLGTNLNGHNGVVHGGIISLLFDDAMGFGYDAISRTSGLYDEENPTGTGFGVTANLKVDFRTSLPQGSKVVLRVFHRYCNGRKFFIDAKLESLDGSILYAEASSLYVVVLKNAGK